MKKTMLSIILVLSLAVTPLAVLSGCSSNDGAQATADSAPAATSTVREVTAPALVKTVTEYTINYDTKEWELAKVSEYTYENDYPSALETYEVGGDTRNTVNYAYTFEDGVPTLCTYTLDSTTTTVEYNEGRIYNVTSQSKDGSNVDRTYYQYGNGDEYFTFLVNAGYSQQPGDGNNAGTTYEMEEADSITVTTKDGLPVKTVNTGAYANWVKGEDKEWMRFNGTYTADYDGDGILSQTSGVFRSGPSGVQNQYALTKKDGRVTEAIVSIPDDETGDFREFTKFVFEYSDIQTTNSRYATMINSFLLDGGGNYYKYNWY